MAFDFLKKIFKSAGNKKRPQDNAVKTGDFAETREKKEEKVEKISADEKTSSSESKQSNDPAEKKPISQMSDDEIEKDLIKKAPELFAHAKTPQMKKMVIDIYRAMLLDNVNVDNEKEVKKWLQKHPEVAQGGSPLPRPQTYKRDEPKIGRNDPCPCGSGKKYKKCCANKE